MRNSPLQLVSRLGLHPKIQNFYVKYTRCELVEEQKTLQKEPFFKDNLPVYQLLALIITQLCCGEKKGGKNNSTQSILFFFRCQLRG